MQGRDCQARPYVWPWTVETVRTAPGWSPHEVARDRAYIVKNSVQHVYKYILNTSRIYAQKRL